MEAWSVCQFDGGDPRRGKARWEMGFVGFVVGYCFGVWDLSEDRARAGGDRPIVESLGRRRVSGVLRDSVGLQYTRSWVERA
jgi:hypothetical protein